ncbi:MAG: methionyl-tRNA formyltransferase [Microbacteriaceae bacterium]|nr:methionyl-tRNA formyltransferase [Microbacteriaceae bacterium]
MRVLFAGSPDAALPCLRALVEAGVQVVGVLTQPARPVGRKRVLTPTPVEFFANEQGLAVFTPSSPEETSAALKACSPDVAIVVAYGRLLDQTALEALPQGWWNVHFSLLPRWRGAAPVAHAIVQGDRETGISLFRLEKGLDTGPIASMSRVPIAAQDTTGTLLTKLAARAPDMVLELLADLASQSVSLSEQTGDVTLAPKPLSEDGNIVWSQPWERVYQQFRAMTPEPGAYAQRSDTSDRVNILEMTPATGEAAMAPGSLRVGDEGILVGTASDPVTLRMVKPAGKNQMKAVDWFRGLPNGVTLVD